MTDLKQPLVSVLMTCYNREKLIASAIESVLASSYVNFELIIADDCSVDKTVEIAKGFVAKDPRIRLYVNEQNLGDYPNRNKAAEYARGKYIKYVDSDDYIYPWGLEIMVNSMEGFPAAGFGLCSLNPPDQQPYPFVLGPKASYEYHFFGPGLFHKGPVTAIFVTTAFRDAGCFLPGRMVSDVDMWHRMALHYPVVLMPDGIVWVRKHAEQELVSIKKYIREYEAIKWKYLKDPACQLSKDQVRKIKKMRIKRYTGFIISGIIKLDIKQSITYLKCLYMVLKINI